MTEQSGRIRFAASGELDPVVKAATRHTMLDIEFTHPGLEEILFTYAEARQ